MDDIDSAERRVGRRKLLAIPLPVGGTLRCDISKFGIILSADFPLKGNDTITAIMGILNAEDIVARVEHEA